MKKSIKAKKPSKYFIIFPSIWLILVIIAYIMTKLLIILPGICLILIVMFVFYSEHYKWKNRNKILTGLLAFNLIFYLVIFYLQK